VKAFVLLFLTEKNQKSYKLDTTHIHCAQLSKCQATAKQTIKKDNRCSFIKHS